MEILLGFIGISVLIFVHELGHFMAAKWAGAKVEKFSLGFDPTIKGFRMKLISWRWGETEYVIGLVPFGGYVKPGEDEETKTGEFTNQPPMKRAIIFAAGAVMNLIFGLGAFIIAFAIGVSFMAPEAGSIIPGSPAWEAGIQPGDRIISIDGKSVESFMDIAMETVLAGCRERTLVIDRKGTRRTITASPRVDPELGMPNLGIGQSHSNTIAAVFPDSAAEKGGVKKDDRIVSAVFDPDGKRIVLDASLSSNALIRNLTVLARYNPEAALALTVVDAAGQEKKLSLAIGRDEKQDSPRLGIRQTQNTVHYVRPGTEAADHFTPGTLVTAINGQFQPILSPWDLAAHCKPGESLTFALSNGKTATLPRDTFFTWHFSGDVVFGPPALVILSVTPESAAEKAGLKPGDRITALNGTPIGSRKALSIPEPAPAEPWAITYRRGEATLNASLDVSGKLGIQWDDRPTLAAPQAGSPAEKAGLALGDRIVSIADTPINALSDVIKSVQAHPKEAMTVAFERNGQEKSLAITPMNFTPGIIGLGFEMKRITIRETNLLKTLGLGYKRTVASIKMIFYTLLRLFRGEVAARNLQGPVGIVHITSIVSQHGMGTLLFFLALISVNLGVLNLLPIPIFDGGHLLLLLFEVIKGKPVNEKVVQTITTVVFFLLITLAVYVTYHDILRLML